MSFIEISNVTKRYDDNLAVDNVSMNIEKGDIFGLLGPNGAGKSTLISMICGLLSIDKGEILIEGDSIKSHPSKAKSHIGLVPQEIALYEGISGVDNLKFWGSMYGLSGKLLSQRIDEALEATELTEKAKESVKKYSGGMKRRLNIAAAIMHHPDILIMDEPTVGIDPQSRNHILEFTKKLNSQDGTTVIYTSHYIEEVEKLCEKIAIVDNGKVIAKGTKEEVKRMTSDEEKLIFYVNNFNEEILIDLRNLDGVQGTDYNSGKLIISVINSQKNLEKILELLVSKKIFIKEMKVDSPSLESVFLSLTGKTLRD